MRRFNARCAPPLCCTASSVIDWLNMLTRYMCLPHITHHMRAPLRELFIEYTVPEKLTVVRQRNAAILAVFFKVRLLPSLAPTRELLASMDGKDWHSDIGSYIPDPLRALRLGKKPIGG